MAYPHVNYNFFIFGVIIHKEKCHQFTRWWHSNSIDITISKNFNFIIMIRLLISTEKKKKGLHPYKMFSYTLQTR